MLSGSKIKELMEKYADDNQTWTNFIEEWIEANPDAVFEIVGDYLDAKVNEPGWNQEQEDWNKYLEDRVISDYEDYLEREAEYQREQAYFDRLDSDQKD